jgi:hypothetical protein
MKKLIIISSIACLTICAMVFTACKKEVVQKNDVGLNQNTETSQIDYELKYDLIIKTVAYGLLDLSSSEVFRNKVNAEVLLQFDGDYNVLLNKLSVVCNQSGINLSEEMENSLIAHNHEDLVPNIDEAINGFNYFDTKLYAQIYIYSG